MTGLEPAVNVIVEIATIVTDDELNIIAEGPDHRVRPSSQDCARANGAPGKFCHHPSPPLSLVFDEVPSPPLPSLVTRPNPASLRLTPE